MNEKIEIVRYLEENTIGWSASAGLVRMAEWQLDLLIRAMPIVRSVCKWTDRTNQTS